MLTIGKLSARTGVKVPTIRYYETVGLMPAAERSGGNQRLYGIAAEHRLSFIRHARELGFPLEAIRDLLGLADHPEHPCDAVDAIARTQLLAVRARIARLKALEDELIRMIGACVHGTVADCRVIEVLGDHRLCAHDDHGTCSAPE
ncbi:MerR family transcriptional regulator [Rhodobacter maris]|uniref:DNA-binding transcriptional MerR regulator n=1 Tax=Rhodobacter maris TaxID=446682 RepID=A0A285S4D5_9RHOB|nr:helix-turn-helix domain-containing protein [Rhodobacter maris]SOB99949.1 DNA-binding transcriptional MerR regulator [Rhodobacter maris]